MYRLCLHCGLYFTTGDDTFNDVFRDFTNMATNNPEKLKRATPNMSNDIP